MQVETTKTVAQTIRDLQVGERASWPIERNLTVRNAASQHMLLNPAREIVCNQDRRARTISATRIK